MSATQMLPFALIAVLPLAYGAFLWLRATFRKRSEKMIEESVDECRIDLHMSLRGTYKSTLPLYEIYDNCSNQAAVLGVLSEVAKNKFNKIGEHIITASQKSDIKEQLSAYEVNQAACRAFAQNLPNDWQIDFRHNGDIGGFIDSRGNHLSTHSWADARALQSHILSHPHDCVVDSNTYQVMSESGVVDILHQQGVSIHDGHYRHETHEPTEASSDSDLSISSHGLHVSDIVLAARAGQSIFNNIAQVGRGDKSVHEGGADVAVDVGISLARLKAIPVGFALGGPMGAVVGSLLVGKIGELLRGLKYSDIKCLLETVGQHALTVMKSKDNRHIIIDGIAAGCMSYDALRKELLAEQQRGKLYNRETRYYSASYTPPTLAGVLCRMRQRRLSHECARVQLAASRALEQSCNLGSSKVTSKGLLGEIVLASHDLFPCLDLEQSEVLNQYNELSAKWPNHPYRVCDQKTSRPINSRDYFVSLCRRQLRELRRLPLRHSENRGMWLVPATVAAAAGLWLVLTPPAWLMAKLGLRSSPETKPDQAALAEKALPSAADLELARFQGMTGQEHLTAAKQAMMDGYDRHRRVGGKLELAERHLRAIPASSGESRDVARMLKVIADRRRRATHRGDDAAAERGQTRRLAHSESEPYPPLRRQRSPQAATVSPAVQPAEEGNDSGEPAALPDG